MTSRKYWLDACSMACSSWARITPESVDLLVMRPFGWPPSLTRQLSMKCPTPLLHESDSTGSSSRLRERFHQAWNGLHMLQPLGYRVAGSGDPTEGLADVEQISHRSTGSGNGVPACYGELMRLEIVDLFDLAVEACVDYGARPSV